MTRCLILAIVGLAVLTAASPALAALARAAVPLMVATGAVLVAVRLVWFFTNRW